MCKVTGNEHNNQNEKSPSPENPCNDGPTQDVVDKDHEHGGDDPAT